jgi:hypothetical protein
LIKKIILLVIILLIVLACYARANTIMFVRNNPIEEETEYTDFTSSGYCAAAYGMTGDGTTEADLSGNAMTLSTQGDTWNNNSNMHTGFSGLYRTTSDTVSRLYRSDGGAIDIYGADQELSVCMWFNANTSSSRLIAAKGDAATKTWLIKYSAVSGKLEFTLSDDGSTDYTAISNTTINNNTWYHMCGVYDDTDIRLYINGVLDSNGADNPKTYSAGLYNSSEYLVFFGAGGTGYIGYLDDVIIMSTALDTDEITSIYQHGIDGSAGSNDIGSTYLFRYNVDHSSGNNYAYTANGSGSVAGVPGANAVTYETTQSHYGTYSYLANANYERIYWGSGVSSYVDDQEGSVELWVYVDAAGFTNTNGLFAIFLSTAAGDNMIRSYIDGSGHVYLRHEGDNHVVTLTTSATLSTQTWQRIRYRWSVINNKIGVQIGGGNWEDDADADPVSAFASDPDMIELGPGSYNVTATDGVYADDFEIIGTYNSFNY